MSDPQAVRETCCCGATFTWPGPTSVSLVARARDAEFAAVQVTAFRDAHAACRAAVRVLDAKETNQ